MNLNNKPIISILNYYNINYNNILIAHDELDLDPGVIKITFGNGHNGHNGLRNLINVFKNKKFYRIRIGIGRPKYCNKISSYVLSNPTKLEKNKIKNIINCMVNITDFFIKTKDILIVNKILKQSQL